VSEKLDRYAKKLAAQPQAEKKAKIEEILIPIVLSDIN
jgi:hypothetical protein